MTTTNFELIDICKYYELPLVDILMQDEIDDLTPNDGFYIVTLADSNTNGVHWVCLYVLKQQVIYFDSFGATPALETIKFIKKRTKKSYFNNWILQNLNTEKCGFYCIINLFVDDTKKNNGILKDFYTNFKPVNPIVKSILFKSK